MPSAQVDARPFPASVLETLAQGGVILCANARAARALSQMYGRRLAQEGLRAWETPQIFDWKQWQRWKWMSLLLNGKETRILLSPLQEEVLWNEIVRPGVESRSLIAASEVARLAMSAYSLLHTYNAKDELQRSSWDYASLEPEFFRRWALEMERRCERGKWILEANLPWVLAEAIESAQLAAPSAILWNGFDVLTPADRFMREKLASAGCSQNELTWDQIAMQRLVAAPTIADELEACALWAKELLRAQPRKAIGVLLPDVEESRAEIDRVFRRVLLQHELSSPPGHGLSNASVKQNAAAKVYEFTLGLPLADVPMITAALALLRWCIEPQEQETITWLMTTGFFSSAVDSATLAEADIKMRKRLSVPELEMDEALGRILRFASPSGGNWAVANWVRSMRQAQKAFQSSQGRDRFGAQWVATITTILKEAGWPGDGTDARHDSIHFQVLDRWQRVLEEASALGFSDRRYSFATFLEVLSAHVRSTIFAPESLEAPIVISGIPESAGRSFEAIWVLGMTDDAWPPVSRMHPLLPAWLQADSGMPGSNSEHDRLLGASMLGRLQQCSEHLVFSYAQEGPEGAQRPSAQIVGLQAETAAEATGAAADLLEPFIDEMLVPWPGGRAAGGQEVLKAQAACPFQAFAAKRLAAKELPTFEPGLSAAENGTIAHKTLDTLWADSRLGDSEQLRAVIADGRLPDMVREHVERAFEKDDALASTAWELSYLRLQKERVCALIVQWLHYESRRKPFKIAQSEKSEHIFVHGLEMNVRMDRIDAVEGGHLLIDYKTGMVKADSWESDRPAEPQLPIYAISGRVESLLDVLFARVHAQEMSYISAVYGTKPDIFIEDPLRPGAAQSFVEICEEWDRVIRSLSLNFQQGIATVTPKNFPETCKFCAFPGLCRVAESEDMTVLNEEDGYNDEEAD